MAKFEKKRQAHKLRRAGQSIKQIAETLAVSKSTASLWCRNIELTPSQKNKLREGQIKAGNYGRLLGAEKNRQKKQANIKIQEMTAKALVGRLSKRDKLMLGIGLYWGEGVKLGSGGASLVNSDPGIVVFIRDWFESLGVKREDFNPYIFISESHKDREKDLIKFWSEQLAIPSRQFHKIIFLKGRPKKVYENHDSYYGILALRIRKSTSLKYKIIGLIKACTVAGVAQVVRAQHS